MIGFWGTTNKGSLPKADVPHPPFFPLLKPASHARTPTRTGACPSGEHQREAKLI